MIEYLFHVDSRDVAEDGTEFDIQRRFINRMKTFAPTVKLVATPNGGKRTAWERRRAQQEGLVAGWPDIGCYWSNGLDCNAVPGIAIIEFKDAKGRLSDEQIMALNWLHNHGFPCGVFRSAATAIDFVRKAGAPFRLEYAA